MEGKLYKVETEIISDTERDNLRISWDDEDGFVFLFTPDMGNTDTHYHIELSKEDAARLGLFLNKKLDELTVKQRKRNRNGQTHADRAARGDWKKAQEILAKAPGVEPEPQDAL